MQFVFVEDGKWKSGASGGVNLVEARETAKLVLKQIGEHPSQSLGVIAFNQRQQFAILDELEKFRSLWPELESEPFFDESREEPFFVKNLENVQGDERDRIIISVGYGYDELGKFAMRFGPLNRQGGERRLNVAVTRAKHQVILVSSIHGNDIDLRRTKSDGARLLRAYLEYAEGGIKTAELDLAEDSQGEGDSDFERQVESELRLRGLNVRRKSGVDATELNSPLSTPTTRSVTFSASSVTGPSTVIRLQQETEIDCVNRFLKVWGGRFVGSGLRTGFGIPSDKLSVCWRFTNKPSGTHRQFRCPRTIWKKIRLAFRNCPSSSSVRTCANAPSRPLDTQTLRTCQNPS